ncbi:hypothetical protein ACWIID_09205 [Streptomyces phaeochromogenes]
MIHEAIDTAIRLGWALFATIAVLSALGTALLLLLAAGLAWAWRRLRPRTRPSWALNRRAARNHARTYREAA